MPELPEQKTAVAELVESLGGPTEAAKLFDVKPPSVSEWIGRGLLPVGRVQQAEAITSSKFNRYKLRPDVFGKEPFAIAATDSARAA